MCQLLLKQTGSDKKSSNVQELLFLHMSRQEEQLQNDFFLDSPKNSNNTDENSLVPESSTANKSNNCLSVSEYDNHEEYLTKFDQFSFILRRIFTITSILEDTIPVELRSFRESEATVVEAIAILSYLRDIAKDEHQLCADSNTRKSSAVNNVRCCVAQFKMMFDRLMFRIRYGTIVESIIQQTTIDFSSRDDDDDSSDKKTQLDEVAPAICDELEQRKEDIRSVLLDLSTAFDHAIAIVEANGFARHKHAYFIKVKQCGELLCALTECKLHVKFNNSFLALREFEPLNSCKNLVNHAVCPEKFPNRAPHADDLCLIPELVSSDGCIERYQRSETSDSNAEDVFESDQSYQVGHHYKSMLMTNDQIGLKVAGAHKLDHFETDEFPEDIDFVNKRIKQSDLENRASEISCEVQFISTHAHQQINELVTELTSSSFPTSTQDYSEDPINNLRACFESAFLIADQLGFSKRERLIFNDEYDCDRLLNRLIDLSSNKSIWLIRFDPSPPPKCPTPLICDSMACTRNFTAPLPTVSESHIIRLGASKQCDINCVDEKEFIQAQSNSEIDIRSEIIFHEVWMRTDDANVSDHGDVMHTPQNCAEKKITSNLTSSVGLINADTIDEDIAENNLTVNYGDDSVQSVSKVLAVCKEELLANSSLCIKEFLFIVLLLVSLSLFLLYIFHEKHYLTLRHTQVPPT